MKKFKSYIFLSVLVLGFLSIGYYFLAPNPAPKVGELINRVDALILENNAPEWEEAFDVIDSNIVAYPELKEDELLKEKYEHLLDICSSLGINKKNNYAK